MNPVRSLARHLLAASYVVDGASALRSPGPRVERARAAGLTDPERLVRANAATRLAGGLALGTGHLPRLAALVLAASTVPTTWVRHTAATGPDRHAALLKDLGLLGGLLLVAVDTGGRESLPHAAGRLSRTAQRRAAKAVHA